MRQITGKKLGKALERHGWHLLRVSGSHHIYGKSGVNARVSIPLHGNKPLKAGLVRHLLKITGLTEDDVK